MKVCWWFGTLAECREVEKCNIPVDCLNRAKVEKRKEKELETFKSTTQA